MAPTLLVFNPTGRGDVLKWCDDGNQLVGGWENRHAEENRDRYAMIWMEYHLSYWCDILGDRGIRFILDEDYNDADGLASYNADTDSTKWSAFQDVPPNRPAAPRGWSLQFIPTKYFEDPTLDLPYEAPTMSWAFSRASTSSNYLLIRHNANIPLGSFEKTTLASGLKTWRLTDTIRDTYSQAEQAADQGAGPLSGTTSGYEKSQRYQRLDDNGFRSRDTSPNMAIPGLDRYNKPIIVYDTTPGKEFFFCTHGNGNCTRVEYQGRPVGSSQFWFGIQRLQPINPKFTNMGQPYREVKDMGWLVTSPQSRYIQPDESWNSSYGLTPGFIPGSLDYDASVAGASTVTGDADNFNMSDYASFCDRARCNDYFGGANRRQVASTYVYDDYSTAPLDARFEVGATIFKNQVPIASIDDRFIHTLLQNRMSISPGGATQLGRTCFKYKGKLYLMVTPLMFVQIS